MTGNSFKILPDQFHSLTTVKVPDYSQHGVIRCVVDAEEFLHVFDRRRVEVFHRANSGMRVCGVLENQFVNSQESVDVRLIVVAQSLLFLYCIALVVQVFLSNPERSHAIAFQPKRERQMTRRQRLVVIRTLG